jgi:cyclic 2,3-diphosphoglycerate synthetase
VIDGEHYVPVVRDALAELPYEFVVAVRAGGAEKLRGPAGRDDYGVPLAASVGEAIRLYAPDVVVDLSDEPVLGPRARFTLAAEVLAAGLPYVGADFRFDPPAFEPFPLPSLSVFGTGKRVGKTAVTGHVARLLAADREVLVVAMGRGGPPEPEVIESPPSVAELLARSRAGRHAASDHLETAVLAGVPTIGCRRAGGGLAGSPFVSNVQAGARLAVERGADVVIFDGSGAAIPPVATDGRILVAHDLQAGLNTYRALIADLVLTMSDDVAAAADSLGRRALRFDLRLEPTEPLAGRPTALLATGPTRHDHLPEIVSVSRALADRDELRRYLAATEAEVFLVELKAAAIDVVAEAAAERGVALVLARHEVVAPGFDKALLELAEVAAAGEARENLRR